MAFKRVTPQVLATSWIVILDLIEQCLVMIMCLDHNIGMVTSELKPLLYIGMATSELKPLLFEMRPNLIFVN